MFSNLSSVNKSQFVKLYLEKLKMITSNDNNPNFFVLLNLELENGQVLAHKQNCKDSEVLLIMSMNSLFAETNKRKKHKLIFKIDLY